MTAEFGPFLESLQDAHSRRIERQQFDEITADLERPETEDMPWAVPTEEPPLWRALLDAVWGLVWPRREEKR